MALLLAREAAARPLVLGTCSSSSSTRRVGQQQRRFVQNQPCAASGHQAERGVRGGTLSAPPASYQRPQHDARQRHCCWCGRGARCAAGCARAAPRSPSLNTGMLRMHAGRALPAARPPWAGCRLASCTTHQGPQCLVLQHRPRPRPRAGAGRASAFHLHPAANPSLQPPRPQPPTRRRRPPT